MPTPDFGKKLTCPSTNTVVAFNSLSLSPIIHLTVESHLAACDFCSAEQTLLRRHAPGAEYDGATPLIPPPLLLLAESLYGNGWASERSEIFDLP